MFSVQGASGGLSSSNFQANRTEPDSLNDRESERALFSFEAAFLQDLNPKIVNFVAN